MLPAPVENLRLQNPEAGIAVAQKSAERTQTLSRFRTAPEKQAAAPSSNPRQTHSRIEGPVLRASVLRASVLRTQGPQEQVLKVLLAPLARPQRLKFRLVQVPAAVVEVLQAPERRAFAPLEVRPAPEWQVPGWVVPQAQPELVVLQQQPRGPAARQGPALVAARLAAAAQAGSGSIQPLMTDRCSVRSSDPPTSPH